MYGYIWRRKWQPTPVFLPEESHGQRSLAGCSPWGHRESDTTEATGHAPMDISHFISSVDGHLCCLHLRLLIIFLLWMFMYKYLCRLMFSFLMGKYLGMKLLGHMVCVCVCVCVSHSVVSNLLRPHGLWPVRLFCPWNSAGKKTGVEYDNSMFSLLRNCQTVSKAAVPFYISIWVFWFLYNFGSTCYCLSFR